MFSLIWTKVSPSGNGVTSAIPSGTPSESQISFASAGLAFPVNIFMMLSDIGMEAKAAKPKRRAGISKTEFAGNRFSSGGRADDFLDSQKKRTCKNAPPGNHTSLNVNSLTFSSHGFPSQKRNRFVFLPLRFFMRRPCRGRAAGRTGSEILPDQGKVRRNFRASGKLVRMGGGFDVGRPPPTKPLPPCSGASIPTGSSCGMTTTGCLGALCARP